MNINLLVCKDCNRLVTIPGKFKDVWFPPYSLHAIEKGDFVCCYEKQLLNM